MKQINRPAWQTTDDRIFLDHAEAAKHQFKLDLMNFAEIYVSYGERGAHFVNTMLEHYSELNEIVAKYEAELDNVRQEAADRREVR